jgi:hypothetical protein
MAKLFIVQPGEQRPADGSDESSEEIPELTGDTARDLETALRAMAFLVDFMLQLEPGEIRRCANAVRDFRDGHYK